MHENDRPTGPRIGDLVDSLLSMTGRPGARHARGRVINISPAGPLLAPCYRPATRPPQDWTESLAEASRRRAKAVGASTLPHGAFGTIALVRWPDGSEAWQATAFLTPSPREYNGKAQVFLNGIALGNPYAGTLVP